jgi:hypothetical protein
MEVHPPHGSIHSVKEFMVHLLAITIGLLIALGLESSVEWVHHRHLARDARENIFQEVRVNQQDVLRELNAMPAEEKHLDEMLSWMDSTQHGHPVSPNWNFMWTTILPRDSAWSAASSTGAIAFMSYDEVKVYSNLYMTQSFYATMVERNLAERHDLNVILFDMQATGKLSEAEFEKGRAIILSSKIRVKEMQEIDNALNTNYNRLLTHEH